MNGLLRGLVVVPLALAGCGGIELVRVATDPPPGEVGPVVERVEAAASCTTSDDGLDEELRASSLEALAAALRGHGVFSGGALGESPVALEAACEARLSITHVSDPVVMTGARMAINVLRGIPPIFAFCFIWTDREPELSYRCVLEVAVRGEPPVGRYEVLAHGTVCAQTPVENAYELGLDEERGELLDVAARALAAHFAADRPAQARLRAQLDEGPALDLEPLIVAKETHAARARWRTRKLVRWKNESLAARVSEAKTSELRTLVGQLEACMLDLTHEAEVSKDAAQGLVASGAASASNARELSLAYRERIEVLRPILTSVKEELEGRGR